MSDRGAEGAGRPLAAVFGCAGTRLAPAERRFFRDADPLGFILFERNAENPAQVRNLVADLRDCVGRADAPVLIDQEGGRVARLKPPHWRLPPAAGRFAAIAKVDSALAAEAVRLNACLIAHDLADLGITVDCAPVLDLPAPGADPIIGDRAAGTDAEEAVALGRAACEGFLAGGVLPVIKHIPGHGRANVDSHKALPVVEAALDELEASDFGPFRALSDVPWAMTAHVIYTAIDPANPATTSAKAVGTVIRGTIGFDGVLISDDIGMNALKGDMGERAAAALAAGCDIVLHCSGDPTEMGMAAAALSPLTDAALRRIERAESLRSAPAAFDPAAGLARLDAILKEYPAP